VSRETSDGLTADGNANLALKSIIALHAMSKISEAVGEMADVGLYSVSICCCIPYALKLGSPILS
jgi:hypothetical protein